MSDTTSASFCSVSCKSKGGQYIEIKQGKEIYQTELYKYSFSVFYKIKDRSTVTSYKKKHWYITYRSEHHHHTNNTRKQRTQQNTTPPKSGEEAKEDAADCAVVANTVPRRSCVPLQARAAT